MYCVLARVHAVSLAHDDVWSASMQQPDPCRQLRVPECLAEADSCRCETEESWKEPHGYMESAHSCKSLRSGILHVHFCQDLLPRKMEFWSTQIWEKRIIPSMLCWIQELSVHTHNAVCGSLWATSQSTRDILHCETVGNFFVTNAMNMVEIFLCEARQHPGVPFEALKFSGQLPAFFLEEVVPVGLHSLQAWKNN